MKASEKKPSAAQKKVDLEHVFEMGYDCGLNGPSTTNCDFRLFSSAEFTKEWEEGKRKGENAKWRSA